MIGAALVASALASAVVAWGVPPSFLPRPEPSHISWGFEPDAALAPGSRVEEIVRSIIRRHMDEVNWCYEQELSRKPKLAGRFNVQFTVAASGQVSAASVQRSTIANTRVESCTVEAVRRWQFPKPLNGGHVIISYPFVLTPRPINADAGATAAKK